MAVYFLILSCAAVTIRTLTGEYYFADWSEAVINAALCLFCLLNGGNVFGGYGNENR
nr:phage holin family protein [Erwinia persicina]